MEQMVGLVTINGTKREHTVDEERGDCYELYSVVNTMNEKRGDILNKMKVEYCERDKAGKYCEQN